MRKKMLGKRIAAAMMAAVFAIPAGAAAGQTSQVMAAENLVGNGSFEGVDGASNGAGWSLGGTELREAESVAVTEAVDVIEDGDFEKENAKWLNDKAELCGYEEGAGRDGGRAAVIERQAGISPYFYFQMPTAVLESGREYTVTYWAKSEEGVGWGEVLCNILDKDNYNLNGEKYAAAQWQEYSYTFVPTKSADYAQIGFQFIKKTGKVYIDDVSVTYAVPKEETVVTTIVSENFESGTINKGNWNWENTTVTCEENQGRDGGYAAVIPRPENVTTKHPYFKYTSATPIFEIGKEYKVTYWARSDGNIGWKNVLLKALTANKWDFNGTKYAATEWQEYSYIFTAEEAKTWPEIGLQLTTGTGTLYFDDFSIVTEEIRPVYACEDGLVKADDNWKLKLSGTSEAIYSGAALTPGTRYRYSYTAKPENAAETGSYGLKAGSQVLTEQTGSFVAEEGMELGFVVAETGDVYFDDLEIVIDENDIGVSLAGYTISLGGTIGMNFYMELSEEVLGDNGAYMQFIVPGEKETTVQVMVRDVKDASQIVDGKTCYIFSCGVAAKDMTKDIQAQIFCSDGKKSQEYTYSVRKYADYMIGNEEQRYAEEEIKMVKAMLNYGAYAQQYFNYNVENLANSSLEAADTQLPDTDRMNLEGCDRAIAGSVEGLMYYGSSLMLTGKTAIRHYFTLEEGSAITDYTFTVGQGAGAKNLTPVQKGERYYVEIENIAAHCLSEVDTVSICKNGSEENCTVTYSAYSYVKTVLSDTGSRYKSELIDVMKALYQYCETAKVLAGNSGN